MLKAIDPSVKKTYVGYTNNILLRLKKHNSNKGAKSTKGYKWLLIYDKKFKSKKIDLKIINDLNLSNVNSLKFPAVKFLKMIPNNISLFETVLVSANDCLVDLFLEKKIKYLLKIK